MWFFFEFLLDRNTDRKNLATAKEQRKMSVFHRKHSNSNSKIQPVLLSSERPSNVNSEALPEEVPDRVEEIKDEVVEMTKGDHKIPHRTIDHFRSFPLVQQTRSFIHQLPVARVFIANTKPVVKQVLESKPLQLALPVTNFFDNVANSSLNLTEKVVPAIKTKTYGHLRQEAMYPCNATVNGGKKAKDKVVTLVDENIYKPSHNQVLKFRSYYNEKFYDTKGRPLVRSSLDPVTRPINNAFENMTIKYFPEGEKVPQEGYSCEVNRSAALAHNLVNRSYPVVQRNIFYVTMIPCNYVVYVNQVFNECLDKQPNLKPKQCWFATKMALGRIKKETIESLKNKTSRKSWRKNNNVNEPRGFKSNQTPVEDFQERIREVENQLQEKVAA